MMGRAGLMAGWLAAALLSGCVSQSQYAQARDDAQASKEEARKALEARDGMQAVVIDQQKQIRTLQALGERRLDLLYRVDHIDLGNYTGGIAQDGQNVDYAVKVYLQPIDADGSVLKASGTVTVQLFDLAADPQKNLIAQYYWPVDQLSKQWASGFLAYHYSFLCPFVSPPQHPDVTVRVEFTDYLTGKTFSAQKLVKVRLAPATQPAK